VERRVGQWIRAVNAAGSHLLTLTRAYGSWKSSPDDWREFEIPQDLVDKLSLNEERYEEATEVLRAMELFKYWDKDDEAAYAASQEVDYVGSTCHRLSKVEGVEMPTVQRTPRPGEQSAAAKDPYILNPRHALPT